MSIDVKDHRRYQEGKLAEAHKEALARIEEKSKVLLPQAPSEQANTGNEQLDKFVRNIQENLDNFDKHATNVALKGIGCIQEDMIRLQQCEFFYNKGRVDMCKELLLVPAQIVAESKPVQLKSA